MIELICSKMSSFLRLQWGKTGLLNLTKYRSFQKSCSAKWKFHHEKYIRVSRASNTLSKFCSLQDSPKALNNQETWFSNSPTKFRHLSDRYFLNLCVPHNDSRFDFSFHPGKLIHFIHFVQFCTGTYTFEFIKKLIERGEVRIRL